MYFYTNKIESYHNLSLHKNDFQNIIALSITYRTTKY